jgi:hypothetical protein
MSTTKSRARVELVPHPAIGAIIEHRNASARQRGGVMPETEGEKVWENRLRRMATRRGLRLVWSHGPGALDGGGWIIVDAGTSAVVAGPDAIGRPHWSLDDVQRYLTEGGGDDDRVTDT